MKKLILCIGMMVCLGGTALAQTSAEAYARYEAKEYKASAELYDKLLKSGKGSSSDHYNAACSWALAGNKDKAFAHLNKSIEKGWANINHLKSDSDLSSLHTDKRWEPMVKQLQAKVDVIEANYNKPLKAQLEQIFESDQQIRREFLAAREKHGMESAEAQALIQKMMQSDAENQKQVIAIIEKYGWPGKSMVGPHASNAAFLVIQHTPREQKEIMGKYLPLLREAVAKGEAAKSQLALMEDRYLMYNDKPQLYGSQVTTNQATKQQELYKVEDEANLDKRRAEMELEPIKDYLKRFGIEYRPLATGRSAQ
ncbi:DUF6624 domain-containing protein [Pontibacter pudoricolor]|uniref:DUF6624 domain-containing protein n=1 Tax=Pontibacter pudoricolor TaxID=2694930 RepID=UPI00139071A6|nr:DUF6624 domain-containing protein [Pontibacter pudoricolor]